MEGVGGCVIVPLLRTISMVLHVSYKEVPLCTCMHIHMYMFRAICAISKLRHAN